MTITTLGTSHGNHTYCRFNSSTLFEIQNRAYLIDAGAPVNALMIRAGKRFGDLKGVFITHMHEDHVGGLPNLIKSLLKHPIEGQHTDIFLSEAEAIEGLDGWLRAQHLAWPSSLVTAHCVGSGRIFDDGVLSVTAIGTRHLAVKRDEDTSFAYLLEAEGKRIIHTGDLSADFSDFPAVALSQPSDLCICEAQHFDMAEALEILKSCPIGKIVFNHVADRWHGEGERKLQQMIERLPYPSVIAHDGDTFDV